MLALGCLLLSLPVTVRAAGTGFQTGALTDELPSEAESLLRGSTPTAPSAEGTLRRLADAALERAEAELSRVSHTAGVLLLVCLLLSLSDSVSLPGSAAQAAALAGVGAIGAASLQDLQAYLQMGLGSLRSLHDYSQVLLPVLSGAAAASGSLNAAAARYAATALMMDVLLTAGETVAAPGICAYAALSLANAALGGETLLAAKKLVKTVCTTVLSLVCMVFTAWISLSGILSGASDTLSARLAKTAISSALPVVGSILSDAAGSLSAAAAVIRGSIGVFGLLAVLGLCLGSVVTLGVRYLAFRLSAALCTCMTNRRLGELIGDLGTCFGMILSLNGAGGLMLFFSIFSLMRTVMA